MWNLPMTNVFPMIIIVFSLWAALVYALHRDFVHAVYWIAAAVLNITVLFMKG